MNARRLSAAVILAATSLLTGCGAITSLFDSSNRLDGFGKIPSGEFNTVVTLPDGVTIDFPELIGSMIGPQGSGSRVLIIGDSIIASTSSRYGNEMCSTLTKLGWQVAVEAQAGEFIDFAPKVVGRRLEESWDTVVLFLGTNFDGNGKYYEATLRETLAAFGPTPMVVLTTAEFRPAQREVNEIIRRVALDHPHMTLLDWSQIAKNPGVIGSDGVHLTANGRDVLVTSIARALEFAPDRNNGTCLESVFRNDSKVIDVMPEPSGESPVDTTIVDAAQTTLP
ncbi:MAG: SGNH/GDSL hydrolase family protein [Actinomycetota bacterium]